MRSPVFFRAITERKATVGLFCCAAVWGGCVSAGWYLLERETSTPAAPREFAAHWPDDSQLPRVPERPTLVVFLHPRCPCSRATLEELSRLTTRIADRASVLAVFLAPQSHGENWHQTDQWNAARRIPGVQVIADVDGLEARRFQADVSGRTLLFDADGVRLFDGGITQSRGHVGDNSGSAAIAELVLRGGSTTTHGRAFGCTLFHSPLTQPSEAPTCTDR